MNSVRGLGLLELFTPGFKLFPVSQEGLVCQGGLVLQADPILCLMVFHCVLQTNNLHNFSDFFSGEFALANDGTYSIREGMYTFIWELSETKKEFGCSGAKNKHPL